MPFLRSAAITVVCALVSTSANADFWSDSAGILTDPLKLERSSENLLHAVERTFIDAKQLEGKISDDVKDHLAQIDFYRLGDDRICLAKGAYNSDDDNTPILARFFSDVIRA